MEANLVYYLWGYFPVTCFRTHVDMRARLALNITSCLHCKLIVYDGPSGKLPIIMEIKGTSRYQTVVASTFQVFVALMEELYQQETVITYTPIYINTAVYNLSTTDTVEISFDNRTHCNGYSLYTRLYVFVFYTSDRKMIRFSLKKDLQFGDKHSGSRYAAGIVFFNHFNGTTEKLVELNTYVGSYKTSDFEIIGTGSKMHVSVFAYTLLASITLRFSISTKKCSTLLVSDNHISYSGYITPVPGKWNEFHINQSSQALLEYNVCYKFQFIYIQIPEYTFKFIFPDVTPMLVTVRYIPLYQFRLRKACYFDMEGSHYRPNWLDSMFETEGIISINSFRVEFCGPLQYSHLQIITLPCKIPCPSIIREIYCSFSHVQANELWEDSANITCDVCNNVYMFCKNIHLRSKSLPLIRIISKVCKYAILQMWTYDPGQFSAMVTFSRNDFLSATSAFTTDTDIFLDISSCVAEIPIRVTKLVKPNAHRETTRHVKTFQ